MKALRYFFGVVVFIFFLAMNNIAYCQPQPCDDPDSVDPCCLYGPEDPLCPIDGGVVGLLAAGAAYGIKRARDARRKKETAE